MKQVLQDLKTGAVVVTEVPEPGPARGRLLVRVRHSLLSAGTESAQVAKGRQSLLAKIREKPQLLRQGLQELRESGVAGVREHLASKFEGYSELGYSCAGVVAHCGDEQRLLAPGTLVACAGAGLANHAEYVSIPMLLSAPVPEGVSAETAAYATVGAIALQGVRQAKAQLGEYVAVIGLGLVGLLAAQLLRAMGCRVAGIDPSANARRRGTACGCDIVAGPDQASEAVLGLSGGLGADAVVICAATPESSPVELAGQLARSRGRVVMVGATGMTIPRESYYLKELSFTLSRSYGPGRYDRRYEEAGLDYPLDYVRFTEQRNLRTFLELAQQGRVEVSRLTTHRFPLAEAPAAYALLGEPGVDRVGILLDYEIPTSKDSSTCSVSPSRTEGPSVSLCLPGAQLSRAPAFPVVAAKPIAGPVGVAFIGVGAYAQGMLLPLLKGRGDVALRAVVERNGSQALQAVRRFGFEAVCPRLEDMLGSAAVQLVFVATRHDSHAALAVQALRAGKHVWLEKPLGLSLEELKEVWQAMKENPACRLLVGFNRPFSPSASWLLGRLGVFSPRLMCYRVNAGFVPPDSWVNDPQIGGGRLLGEGCHFFDFLRQAAGANVLAELVHTETPAAGQADLLATGNFAATVRFSNGSVGQLLYSAQGAPGLGKEQFECFSGQMCGALHDYKSAEFYHQARRERLAPHRQDKGQAGLLAAFLAALRNGAPPPRRPEDILESSLLTLAAQESLISRQPVSVAKLRQQFL